MIMCQSPIGLNRESMIICLQNIIRICQSDIRKAVAENAAEGATGIVGIIGIIGINSMIWRRIDMERILGIGLFWLIEINLTYQVAKIVYVDKKKVFLNKIRRCSNYNDHYSFV